MGSIKVMGAVVAAAFAAASSSAGVLPAGDEFDNPASPSDWTPLQGELVDGGP